MRHLSSDRTEASLISWECMNLNLGNVKPGERWQKEAPHRVAMSCQPESWGRLCGTGPALLSQHTPQDMSLCP